MRRSTPSASRAGNGRIRALIVATSLFFRRFRFFRLLSVERFKVFFDCCFNFYPVDAVALGFELRAHPFELFRAFARIVNLLSREYEGLDRCAEHSLLLKRRPCLNPRDELVGNERCQQRDERLNDRGKVDIHGVFSFLWALCALDHIADCHADGGEDDVLDDLIGDLLPFVAGCRFDFFDAFTDGRERRFDSRERFAHIFDRVALLLQGYEDAVLGFDRRVQLFQAAAKRFVLRFVRRGILQELLDFVMVAVTKGIDFGHLLSPP
nr:MAG TPA: hypothetical protein [Caudoviricetes sp.]